MAVREFIDHEGRQWRAWDIKPESIHPQTKVEDYLADCYQDGWIVFETFDGSDKRRLYPPPRDWDLLPEGEFLRLLARAERIPLTKLARQRSTVGETPISVPKWTPRPDDYSPAAEEAIDVTDLRVVRSFLYPGGRLWTVSLSPSSLGGGHVLRFSSGARHLDMEHYPREWPDYPDQRLVELLRSASVRRPDSSPPPGVQGRRYTDPRPSGSVEDSLVPH